MRKEGLRIRQGWLAVACLCLVAAAAFWWRGLADASFVAAALGVVAWFLNVRAQLRRNFADEEETEEESKQ
ncbi:MAG: hypothetical protein LC802_13440 [Acidobacteria bacterium]|nr:hypothetical protein [Acidobacteriota bacterium]